VLDWEKHTNARRYWGHPEAKAIIRIQLGHEDLQATMVYLQLDLTHRRKVQKKFVEFNRSVLIDHPEIKALFNNQNENDIMVWLDSL